MGGRLSSVIRCVSVAAVMVLASAPTVSAEKLTRESLDCPVSEDWYPAAVFCPCEDRWSPDDALLKRILDGHAEWLETGKHATRLASARRAILRKADLEEFNLRKANLQDADLRGAYLEDAKLQIADLKDANLFEADLRGAKLGSADLKGAYLGDAKLRYADLSDADLGGASLGGADLRDADLRSADLRRAKLFETKLQGADLGKADLRNADLRRADLQAADLTGADLEEADFTNTDLRQATLLGANVANATLAFAKLAGALYQPTSAPPAGYLAGIEGLKSLSFGPGQQTGLVQLRALLREGGLRALEREATFAIEHNKALHARGSGSGLDRIGGWIQLILFEGTTGWGLYPSRALLVMLGLMVALTAVYAIPISALPAHASNKHGIFQVWPAERIEDEEDGDGVRAAGDVRVHRLTANGPTTLSWALYFSLLSAFHIGWRDLNVGSWLTRMQPSEYTLRARGWVRVVSGL